MPWRDAGAIGVLMHGGLGVRERIDACTCTAARFDPFEHIQASKSDNPWASGARRRHSPRFRLKERPWLPSRLVNPNHGLMSYRTNNEIIITN